MITHEPLIALGEAQLEAVFDLAMAGAATGGAQGFDFSHTSAQRYGGLRLFLNEREGEGYWDFFRASPHLLVSVTDATYREKTRVTVEGSGYFKLRLMLSGELLDLDHKPLLRGPQAMFFLSPSEAAEGYFIAPGSRARMVVFHCRRDLLVDELGLDPSRVPAPLDGLFDDSAEQTSSIFGLSAAVLKAVRGILDSRNAFTRDLRGPYLQAVCTQVICHLLNDFALRDAASQSGDHLSTRDINRLIEARDYLAQHYASPPRIPQLAALVGVNQTKLKKGFRSLFGETIYDFVIRCRMERASELLLSRDHSVSEVAYQVGYEYPANFTSAFKKHFGDLPRSWRRGQDRKP